MEKSLRKRPVAKYGGMGMCSVAHKLNFLCTQILQFLSQVYGYINSKVHYWW